MTFLKNDEQIEQIILNLVENYKYKIQDKSIYKNVLDPFSSMIEASIHEFDYSKWIKAETARQHQKTLQNSIGNLHQILLSNIKEVEDLTCGNVVDIVCHSKKIIAEIKNKFNTTKGNHKKEIYDDLSSLLATEHYKEYIGYYVEIIPKKPEQYNYAFTPSDNTKQEKREAREDIRIIDGRSFYELLTGDKDAIFKMHDKISEILIKNFNLKTSNDFQELLSRAYGS